MAGLGWAGTGVCVSAGLSWADLDMGWRRLGWVVKRWGWAGWRKIDWAWERGGSGLGSEKVRLERRAGFGRRVFLSYMPRRIRIFPTRGGRQGRRTRRLAQTGAAGNETRDGYDDGRIKSKTHAMPCDGTGWRWRWDGMHDALFLTNGESDVPASPTGRASDTEPRWGVTDGR